MYTLLFGYQQEVSEYINIKLVGYKPIEMAGISMVAGIVVLVTAVFTVGLATLIVLCAKAKQRRGSSLRTSNAVHYDASNIPSFSYVGGRS